MPAAGYMPTGRDLSAARTFGKRVFVVDENALVRWALQRMVGDSEDLIAVGAADSADAALAVLATQVPDVVIVDCGLPADAGWQLARTARAAHPQLGIVVTTATDADGALLRALDLGASAYLAKTAPVADIMAAIRHAAISAGSFRAAGLPEALRRRTERTTGQVTLSGRERQVLTLLRDGHSVPEVAALLFVSLSTAKTYVARLYEKLGAKNRAQALMAAVELGMFEAAPLIAV